MLKTAYSLSPCVGLICLLATSAFAEEPAPGSLDADFFPQTFASEVMSIAVDENRLLVSGWFTNVGPYVTALQPDGTIDPAFDIGSGPNSLVRRIALSDNAIYIAGSFTSFNGTARKDIARLSTTGALDPDFDAGTGFNNRVERIIPLSDGKLLAAGAFSNVQGQSLAGIARLNSDGTLDGTFGATTGTDWTVNDMIRLDDGRIVIGGLFGSYNGTSSNRIAVLNEDGTLDGTFQVGSGFNAAVTALLRTAGGKILVAGSFSAYNGTPRQRLALLNSDGTLDETFDAGSGPDGTVSAMAEDSAGRIVLVGSFTSVDSVARSRIARILPTGALDIEFDPGSGANSTVNTVADLGAEGALLIGGAFTSYDNQPVGRFARIIGGPVGGESGYRTWLTEFFDEGQRADPNITGPGADPEGDGVANLLEYAFGGNPNLSDPEKLPQPPSLVNQNGEDFLQISFTRRQAAWDVLYVVQASTDLVAWSDIWTSADYPYSSTQEQITQTVTDVEPYDGRRFLRVMVILDENAEQVDPPPPAEGFADWRATHFSAAELEDETISGATADPDGDGFANLLEYALNGNPREPNRGLSPALSSSVEGSDTYLAITFNRLRDAPGLTYTVQASVDLAGWAPIWTSNENPYTGEGEVSPQTVVDTISLGEQPLRFLRLNILLEE